MTKELLVFVASPADMKPERDMVDALVSDLNAEFDGEVKLVAYLYEEDENRMTASTDMETQLLPNLRKADIAVCMFGEKLGTPLSEDFLFPTEFPRASLDSIAVHPYDDTLNDADGGSIPVTGSVFEFLYFRHLHDSGESACGQLPPEVYCFLHGDPDNVLDHSMELHERGFGRYRHWDYLCGDQRRPKQAHAREYDQQIEWLQRFVDHYFRSKAAVTVFGDDAQFRSEFEKTIRQAMARLDISVSKTRIADVGSGLLPIRDARDFRGREDELEGYRRHYVDTDLLFIHGAPGVGKSSFLMAGIVDKLEKGQWKEVGQRKVVVIRPEELLFDKRGVLDKFTELLTNTLTDFASPGGDSTSLGDVFRASSSQGGRSIVDRVAMIEEKIAALDNASVVVAMDQFEQYAALMLEDELSSQQQAELAGMLELLARLAGRDWCRCIFLMPTEWHRLLIDEDERLHQSAHYLFTSSLHVDSMQLDEPTHVVRQEIIRRFFDVRKIPVHWTVQRQIADSANNEKISSTVLPALSLTLQGLAEFYSVCASQRGLRQSSELQLLSSGNYNATADFSSTQKSARDDQNDSGLAQGLMGDRAGVSQDHDKQFAGNGRQAHPVGDSDGDREKQEILELSLVLVGDRANVPTVIGQAAETAWKRFVAGRRGGRRTIRALETLLSSLVTLTQPRNKESVARSLHYVDRDEFTNNELNREIQLLVTELCTTRVLLDEAGRVGLAHECVLDEWQVAREWLDEYEQEYRVLRLVEASADAWNESGQIEHQLLRFDTPYKDIEFLDFERVWGLRQDTLGGLMKAYLRASLLGEMGRPQQPDCPPEVLYWIACAADLEVLEKYVMVLELPVNAPREKDGRTPLFGCAFHGVAAPLKFLISKGALVDWVADDKTTPLMIASYEGHEKVVSELLHHGAEPLRREENGVHAASWAAQSGHLKSLRLLVSANQSVLHLSGYNGSTVLDAASLNGRISTVQWILSQPDVDATRQAEHGGHAFDDAAQEGHLEIAQALLAHSPDLLNLPGFNGRTALIAAATANAGGTDMLEWLLEQPGIDTSLTDKYGRHALDAAASEGRLDAVQRLVQHSPELVNKPGQRGRSALMAAAFSGHLPIVDWLLSLDTIDTGMQDENGAHALDDAAQQGYFEIVQALYAHSPQLLNLPGYNGRTALMAAAYNGQSAVLEWLLAMPDINVDYQNPIGSHALLLGSERGHTDVVRQLASASVSTLDTPNREGQTALLSAAIGGHVETVSYLLSVGADRLGLDKNRMSAMQWAGLLGHQKIRTLLQRKNEKIVWVAENQPELLLDSVEPWPAGVEPSWQWQEIPGREWGEYQRELLGFLWDKQLDVHVPTGRLCNARIRRLACSDELDLAELCYIESGSDEDAAPGVYTVFVDRHSRLVHALVNGHSKVLHNLRMEGRISLELAVQVEEYSEIFCRYVYADGKPFDWVGSIRQLDSLPQLGSALFESFGDHLLPCNISYDAEASQWIMVTTVRFGSQLNLVVFKLPQNSGELVMICDQSITEEGLSIASQALIAQVAARDELAALKGVLAAFPEGLNGQDAEGNCALSIAAFSGQLTVVEWLSSQDNIDYSLQDEKGGHALDDAAQPGHLQIVQVLCEKAPELLNKSGYNGRSALMAAAHNGHIDVVEWFLAQPSINTDHQSNSGAHALLAAAQHGHTEIVRLLATKNPALLDQPDQDGRTALMAAAIGGHAETVAYLMSTGAARLQLDNSHMSAIQLADLFDRRESRLLLQRKDSKVDWLTTNHSRVEMDSTLSWPVEVEPSWEWQRVAQTEWEYYYGVLLDYLWEMQLDSIVPRGQSGVARSHVMVCSDRLALVEMCFVDNDNVDSKHASVYSMLVDRDSGAVKGLLNGYAKILHKLRNGNQLSLDSEAQVKEYSELFCRYVHASGKPFYWVESSHQVAAAGSMDAESLEALNDQLVPCSISYDKQGDQWIMVTTVQFGSSLSLVVFSFKPESGDLVMLDDQSIAQNGLAMAAQSLIVKVAVQDKVAALKTLLSRFPERLNGLDENGNCALWAAAFTGQATVVEWLLEQKEIDIGLRIQSGGHALDGAVQEGHLEIAKKLFACSADLLNAPGSGGRSALMAASFNGHIEIVDWLLQQEGLDVAMRSETGGHALDSAAQEGHLDVVRHLVRHSASLLNSPGNGGRSALMAASFNGHLEVVDWLLKQDGLDVAMRGETGGHTLDSAAQEGHLSIVEHLLSHSRDLLNAPGNGGRSALMAACHNGQMDVVDWLLGQDGLDVAMRSEAGGHALDVAAQEGHLDIAVRLVDHSKELLNAPGNGGRSALTAAAYNGHLDIVNWLLQQEGLDVAMRSETGGHALDIAAQQGHLDIAARLITHSKDLLNVPGNGGRSALMAASFSGHLSLVKWLLSQEGIDTSVQDENGGHVLDDAAQQGHLEVVQTVYAYSPELLNKPGFNGRTALIAAAQNGHEAIVAWLLEQDAIDLHHRSDSGAHVLSVSAQGGHTEIVALIFEAAKDLLDLPGAGHQTALVAAAASGHVQTVQYLLSRGADRLILDANQMSALQLGRLNDHAEVCSLLDQDSGKDAWKREKHFSVSHSSVASWPDGVEPTWQWAELADDNALQVSSENLLEHIWSMQLIGVVPDGALQGIRRYSPLCATKLMLLEYLFVHREGEQYSAQTIAAFVTAETGDVVVVLTGNASALHQCFAAGLFQVDTGSRVADYCELFCRYIASDGGAFHIVGAIEQLSSVGLADGETQENRHRQVMPVGVEFVAGTNQWTLIATVRYAEHMFLASFEFDPKTGAIGMTGDVPLGERSWQQALEELKADLSKNT